MQIYPVSEGYLRKIPVESRGKYLEPLQRRGTFDCPGNRYFSQITLTNRIYLFNSDEYITASKTVACKQVQNVRPPRSFDFQDLSIYENRKNLFKEVYLWNKIKKFRLSFFFTLAMVERRNPSNSNYIRDVINYLKKGFLLERGICLQYRGICLGIYHAIGNS